MRFKPVASFANLRLNYRNIVSRNVLYIILSMQCTSLEGRCEKHSLTQLVAISSKVYASRNWSAVLWPAGNAETSLQCL